MPDDEPLDDARAVGTAAAAAAARVTESVARHVSDAKARERAVLERAYDQQAAQQALSQLDRQTQARGDDRPVGDIDRARAWAQTEDPERLRRYEAERMGSGTPDGRRGAEGDLVRSWKTATQTTTEPYDSTEQRGRRDAAREEAGVPLEGRRVVAVADQMNGQDPALAGAVGKAQATRTKAAVPVQERTRSR